METFFEKEKILFNTKLNLEDESDILSRLRFKLIQKVVHVRGETSHLNQIFLLKNFQLTLSFINVLKNLQCKLG